MSQPSAHQQLQLLLRLPDAIAVRVQHAIQKAEEAASDTGSSSSSSSSSPSSSSTQTDAPLSLEGLGVRPDESEGAHSGQDYILEIKTSHVGEIESYPALLANLPCVVETHKTQDKNTFYKSNDVGQVLQVFMDSKERDNARNDLRRFGNLGFNGTSSDGLTAPTSQIIPRKYVKTRPANYGKYKKGELQEIIDEVSVSALSDGLLDQPEDIVFQTIEEVVDFEDWMISEDKPKGISFALEGNEWNKDNVVLQAHPEILMTEVSDQDIEEEVNKHFKDINEDEIDDTTNTNAFPVSTEKVKTKDDDGLFGSDDEED